MKIRRGLLAQMAASGKSFISGTVTAPAAIGTCTIDFGRTSNNYLFIIEATTASQETILDCGEAADKAYAWYGAYPTPGVGALSTPINYTVAWRVKPSTSVLTNSITSVPILANDSISIASRAITSSNPNNMYYGLSYNYTIVFLD